MKAIGNNLIVKPYKAGVTKTKGGLFLAEKQREDIRYEEGIVLSAGSNSGGIKENDVIYFDKNNAHQIEIKKEIYKVVNINHVVVVL
jgi:co-chaperonin GroES (HSP10)|tara:strand:+ start:1126 stop:1386 length:261 start_codon:yes stop_codon:yes gene_type:complete